MEARLARRIGELAEQGAAFAVCVVARATGSVPGKVGSAMIVRADGAMEGTVGGAGLEERVRKAALDALDARKGTLLKYDLANWKPEGLDSVCGGTVEVAIDVVNPPPHLLLFGGGHCAKALTEICDALGWRYTVVDERAAFASAERFPRAAGTAGGVDPAGWAAREELSRYTHCYLLGHSHHVDTAILLAALPRFAGTFGVIGSKAKRVSMFERARKAGLDDALLARVKCPIGIDIGAEAPAEIAVAVAAEIIRDAKRA